MKKPNIIIFNPDQYRTDALGHMGNEAGVTPNFDRIVREDAVSFSNAFCQNPVCTPSRCSFMSGWYPHVRGHRTMFHMMKEDEPVLLKTLKEEGYFVWWGGKNDLTPAQNSLEPYCDVFYEHKRPLRANLHEDQSWRAPKGHEDYHSFYAGKLDTGEEDVYYDQDWSWVEGAVELIKNPPKDKPFVIYLPLIFPHPVYGVEDPWYSMIDRGKPWPRIPAPASWEGKPSMTKGIFENQNLSSWSDEKWTELRATYLGMCARVDHQFGMLMDALKETGAYDDTAVFVFSDHGDYTGDYGIVEKSQNTFEDCLTKVPFIIKPPKDIPLEPGVKSALVELVDFPATVEAMTGIVPEHTHFGQSLLPVISGEKTAHRDAVFCEGGRLYGERHCMELEQPDHIFSFYGPRVNLQHKEEPYHTKAIMCRTDRYKYVKRLYEQDEFYDLKEDPWELTNRINDPSLREVIIDLKERTLTHYLETADVVPHKADSRGCDVIEDV